MSLPAFEPTADGSAEEARQALIAGLEAEHRCYEAFAVLSRRQMEMIEAGQAAALLHVLAQKQQILEEIDRVEKRLAPLKTGWPSLRQKLPSDRRLEVEDAIDHVRDALAQVIDLERRSEQRLCQLKTATQEEIQRTASGRQVHAAYGQSNRPTGNRYLDTIDG